MLHGKRVHGKRVQREHTEFKGGRCSPPNETLTTATAFQNLSRISQFYFQLFQQGTITIVIFCPTFIRCTASVQESRTHTHTQELRAPALANSTSSFGSVAEKRSVCLQETRSTLAQVWWVSRTSIPSIPHKQHTALKRKRYRGTDAQVPETEPDGHPLKHPTKCKQ